MISVIKGRVVHYVRDSNNILYIDLRFGIVNTIALWASEDIADSIEAAAINDIQKDYHHRDYYEVTFYEATNQITDISYHYGGSVSP